MIHDLHSHTYYSFCGKDSPEDVVKTAIAGGIEVLGITDHNYGIARERKGNVYPVYEKRLKDYKRAMRRYYEHIKLIADKYSNQIQVKIGVEIATVDEDFLRVPEEIDMSIFDFCLIESLGGETSFLEDPFAYAKWCGCKWVGFAHTDLFGYCEKTGQNPMDFFAKMKENNMFWELNVNYDSIHKFRKHEYVTRFFESEEQQEIVRKSGVHLSIGFDGHNVEDYLGERVKMACEKVESMGIPLVKW
jgi:histidinol phosphatase-like PHP family hydrolase